MRLRKNSAVAWTVLLCVSLTILPTSASAFSVANKQPAFQFSKGKLNFANSLFAPLAAYNRSAINASNGLSFSILENKVNKYKVAIANNLGLLGFTELEKTSGGISGNSADREKNIRRFVVICYR